jgi:nucleotide-binding universal stress UspA family protein
VLIKEASGSPLAVVGARGRGGFAQLMLGSVGLQMLIHAECPVALVRNLPPE